MSSKEDMWEEISLDVHGRDDEESLLLEMLTALLSEQGISGVVVEYARDRARTWKTPYGEDVYLVFDAYPEKGFRIRWYQKDAFDKDDVQVLLDNLSRHFQAAGLTVHTLALKTRSIHEDDWAHAWKAYYHPMPIGTRFLIVPSWEDVPQDLAQGRFVLRLEPGMAFGTGTHASTILSLLAIERYVKHDDDVLDVGTGTGILAMAAAFLTGGRLVATDLDPVAIRSAEHNISLNGLMGRIELWQGNLLEALPSDTQPFDVIVSNILPEVLMEMIPHLDPFMKPEATLVLSGIVTSRLAVLDDVLKAHDFVIQDTFTQDDWVTIVVRRSS